MIIQIVEKTRNPIFNYKKLHKFDKINDILLNYLSTARVYYFLFRLFLKFMLMNL